MALRRRPLLWLLAAFALFGLAALVVRACGAPEPVARRPPPELPRRLRPAEVRRMQERQTLPVLTLPQQSPRTRDPVLSALSAPGAATAVVFEANALRNSPLGQLLLDCLQASRGGPDAGPGPIEWLREQGVDPLQDVDRVALGDEGMVVSGDFRNARWESILAGATPTPYGGQGQIYSLQTRDGGAGPVVAAWGNQLLVVAQDEDSARATLDRVEGRGPPGGQLLGDQQAYGDVYGVVGGSQLAGLLGGSDGALGEQVRQAASSVELHVDATRDVGVVANVQGTDPAKLGDLGKALGGALVAARARAVASGDTETAELLEYARVVPGGDTFRLEVAVPLEVIQARLASCGRAPRADAGR